LGGGIIILIFGKIFENLKILRSYRRKKYGGSANPLESFSFPPPKKGLENADKYLRVLEARK
jgi:hypothetical protein